MNGDELLVYLSVWEDKEFIGRSVGFEEWILLTRLFCSPKGLVQKGRKAIHIHTYL